MGPIFFLASPFLKLVLIRGKQLLVIACVKIIEIPTVFYRC